MLYPPAWVARRNRRTAAAAGGCILIRPRALDRIGGIAAIRGAIIDDCALARAVKRSGGGIWLGVTNDSRSIRDYTTFSEIRAMISRTAFAQLHHSALLLAGTILGMAIVYLAPPLLLLTRNPLAAVFGLAAWILMIIAYVPTLRFYGRSIACAPTRPGVESRCTPQRRAWNYRVLGAPLLPLVALFYLSATLDSALSYWTGRGGVWKDRVQDAR
jgi:hypothetical protein